ncbi:MAG: PQQ-dependent dehydrogenase, methanol/ethanol family [Alphaproteobacteria bacterium]
MKIVAVAAVAALPFGALAQTAADLRADATTPGTVLNIGMGQGQQRFSALDQINKTTVKRLVPVWNYSLNDDRGQESQPMVWEGVMYVTSHKDTVALDAKSGRQLWKHSIEYPPETPRIVCCGILNRGAALYEGKLFRTTLDANVIALDQKTGEQIWKAKAGDIKDGQSQTVAPLVANGVVITGISGGEYGIRGYIDGWDPDNGTHLWRRYTVAGEGEKGADTWPGDTWKRGGAPTWITGSYDPDLNLVYWGTGNGGPWNAEFRKGDNLYIASVIAVRPKTGEIVWHYQFSPNDPFDYDAVAEPVLADIDVNGTQRKVLMQANRNGYFYVLDRATGELLAANQYIEKLNWADGIDMKTGRPIDSELTKKVRTSGEAVDIFPSAFGGKNWFPMSYNPGTGLAYSNTLNFGLTYKFIEPKFQYGTMYVGYDFSTAKWIPPEEGQALGYLKAIDPMTGKSKWKVPLDVPNWSGTITTAGGLVFTGSQTGEFAAYDADTGAKLWKFQTGSGIISQPVTWEADGRQYITTTSGSGGAFALYSAALPGFSEELVKTLANVPAGGSVWTFALIEE